MKTLSEIIEIIKEFKNVLNDGDVAGILKIKPKTLATAKLRNSIPYEALTTFCNNEGLSLNWLLTGVDTDKIEVYNAEEKEICKKLLRIIRTKQDTTVMAIKQNIEAFLTTPDKIVELPKKRLPGSKKVNLYKMPRGII